MLVTVIPKNNLVAERRDLIEESFPSLIFGSHFECLKFLISRRKDISIVEIWYPQHFFLLLTGMILRKKLVFSPVTNSFIWIKNFSYVQTNWRYTLRRLRFFCFEQLCFVLAHVVHVQDSSHVNNWPSKAKIRVVNNTIPEIKTSNINRDRRGVVSIGNLESHKLYFWNMLSPYIAVEWYGKSSSFKRIPNNLRYKGLLKREHVFRVLQSSNLLFHPSCYEGSPRVVYEAIAVGTLVLVSDELIGLDDLKESFREYFISDPRHISNQESPYHRIVAFNYRALNARKNSLYELVGIH